MPWFYTTLAEIMTTVKKLFLLLHINIPIFFTSHEFCLKLTQTYPLGNNEQEKNILLPNIVVIRNDLDLGSTRKLGL